MNREFAITTLSPKVQFYLYLGAVLAIAIAFSPVILKAWHADHSTMEPLRDTIKSVTTISR